MSTACEFTSTACMQDFDFPELDDFKECYPQGYHKTTKQGYDVDVKGYDVAIKGYDVAVKGLALNSPIIAYDDVAVKGYDVDVKGYD
eukprot:5304111-Pyramimonas_sp.AAC.1